MNDEWFDEYLNAMKNIDALSDQRSKLEEIRKIKSSIISQCYVLHRKAKKSIFSSQDLLFVIRMMNEMQNQISVPWVKETYDIMLTILTEENLNNADFGMESSIQLKEKELDELDCEAEEQLFEIPGILSFIQKKGYEEMMEKRAAINTIPVFEGREHADDELGYELLDILSDVFSKMDSYAFLKVYELADNYYLDIDKALKIGEDMEHEIERIIMRTFGIHPAHINDHLTWYFGDSLT